MAKSYSYLTPSRFEGEVRQAADAVWDLNPGTCQPEHYFGVVGVHEVDGRAVVGEVVHLIMMTQQTKIKKVRTDVDKLLAAKAHEEKKNRHCHVSMWMVSNEKLDAQHIKEAQKKGVRLLTLEEFKRRYFDGPAYLDVREQASFGSARDPESNTPDIAHDEYVPLPMSVTDGVTTTLQDRPSSSIRVNELKDRLDAGAFIVLMAPFGSGKSLTTREVFFELMKDRRRDKDRQTPISLNLRKHSGQKYAEEMLTRHAREIGFEPPNHIVRAWRGGMATLLLDGFDELTPQTVTLAPDRHFMQEARYQALEGVRQLVKERGRNTGVLLVGRDHFFDNLSELQNALGLRGQEFAVVRLFEFDEEGAKTYLAKKGIDRPLPDWIPKKPLFLGWAASKGLLADAIEIDSAGSRVWDHFLEQMCERDADLAGMTGPQIRSVLEWLACTVRSKTAGDGPITPVELAEVYRHVTGQAPDNRGLLQLQRLPGLTPRDDDPGSRAFVDEDLLAALQGSALVRIMIQAAELPKDRTNWLNAMPSKAVAMASEMLRDEPLNMDAAAVLGAARNSIIADLHDPQPYADAIVIAMQLALDSGADFNGQSIVLEGGSIDKIDLEEVAITNLTLRFCIINEIIVGLRQHDSSVRIEDCMVAKVRGVADVGHLPSHIFFNTEVAEFDNIDTNNAVQHKGYPPKLTALVLTLRRLYDQAGRGRKRSAFYRGIIDDAVVACIDDALSDLKTEDMLSITKDMVHPIRGQHQRAQEIIQNPLLASDPLAKAART